MTAMATVSAVGYRIYGFIFLAVNILSTLQHAIEVASEEPILLSKIVAAYIA
jgi:hypothetical protein